MPYADGVSVSKKWPAATFLRYAPGHWSLRSRPFPPARKLFPRKSTKIAAQGHRPVYRPDGARRCSIGRLPTANDGDCVHAFFDTLTHCLQGRCVLRWRTGRCRTRARMCYARSIKRKKHGGISMTIKRLLPLTLALLLVSSAFAWVSATMRWPCCRPTGTRKRRIPSRALAMTATRRSWPCTATRWRPARRACTPRPWR